MHWLLAESNAGASHFRWYGTLSCTNLNAFYQVMTPDSVKSNIISADTSILRNMQNPQGDAEK